MGPVTSSTGPAVAGSSKGMTKIYLLFTYNNRFQDYFHFSQPILFYSEIGVHQVHQVK